MQMQLHETAAYALGRPDLQVRVATMGRQVTDPSDDPLRAREPRWQRNSSAAAVSVDYYTVDPGRHPMLVVELYRIDTGC